MAKQLTVLTSNNMYKSSARDQNHLINIKRECKWIQIHIGNPFKRKPTQINFPRLAIGFSLFGGWKFCFMRGIDVKWMDANPYINPHGIHFTPDTKWCDFGKGYPEQGWGVYYHTKK